MEPFHDYRPIRRKKEIDNMRAELSRTNNLFIVGPAGIGKTTLLRMFQQEHDYNYQVTATYTGYEIDNYKDVTRELSELKKYKTSLLIIDGFDEIFSSTIKESILSLIKEGRKFGITTIITAREERSIEKLSTQGATYYAKGINKADSILLLNDLLSAKGAPKELTSLVLDTIQENNNPPRYIHKLAEWLADSKELSAFEKALSDDLDYRNDFLISYINDRKIIVPEQKKLITDLVEINDSLLEKIRRRPEEMYLLKPRQFEQFVAEYFEREGYDVELTPETRDGGKDIIVTGHSAIGKILVFVECKRYSASDPVSVNVVQQLHGAVTAEKATAGVVVTSSYFSKPAIKFTKTIQHQMSLIDYIELTKKIKQ